eukprot:scaffold2388_cov201-Skeletonema_marinoi.AAC.8
MLCKKTLHIMTITLKSSEKDLSHSIPPYGPTCVISNKTQWCGYVGYPVVTSQRGRNATRGVFFLSPGDFVSTNSSRTTSVGNTQIV